MDGPVERVKEIADERTPGVWLGGRNQRSVRGASLVMGLFILFVLGRFFVSEDIGGIIIALSAEARSALCQDDGHTARTEEVVVPSHKIIPDGFEFIFGHPLLNFRGWYLILHEAIGHALEETVGSRKMCRLLEIFQELVPVFLGDIMRDKWMCLSGSRHGWHQGKTVL